MMEKLIQAKIPLKGRIFLRRQATQIARFPKRWEGASNPLTDDTEIRFLQAHHNLCMKQIVHKNLFPFLVKNIKIKL